MITILRRCVEYNIKAATLKVKVTARLYSKIVSGPKLCYLKSDFTNSLHQWSSFWDNLWRATFGSLFEGQGLTFQHNRVQPITSSFEVLLKIFHINDHHVETKCRAQHLGCYLEGQGHNMTVQQYSFQPITLWFEVKFYTYFTGVITLLRQRVACSIWVATLKAKVTA